MVFTGSRPIVFDGSMIGRAVGSDAPVELLLAADELTEFELLLRKGTGGG